jgi:hypothetical protein
MSTYTILSQELSESTPDNVNVIPAPFDVLQPPEMQVLTTYHKLQRSARRKDRLMTLVYAYYLGELLEMTTNRGLRTYLNSHLTRYYSLVARRTYCLFEKTGVEQIYRTKKITMRQIYQMPFSDYQLLIGH